MCSSVPAMKILDWPWGSYFIHFRFMMQCCVYFCICSVLWYPLARELFCYPVVFTGSHNCWILLVNVTKAVTHFDLWIREHFIDTKHRFFIWRLDVHVLQPYCGTNNACLYIARQTSYIKPLGVEIFPWNFSIWRRSHIPLPLVAALLQWNFGTGHEADITTILHLLFIHCIYICFFVFCCLLIVYWTSLSLVKLLLQMFGWWSMVC